MGARQRKQQPQRQREMIPRQREGLVYAVVVDQFDLERPVRVQRQPASREHQVDLELVGWREREDAQLSTIIVRKMVG